MMRPGDHGFLAAVLGPACARLQSASMPLPAPAGLIWPGDRVDLILTQNIQDTSLPVGLRV